MNDRLRAAAGRGRAASVPGGTEREEDAAPEPVSEPQRVPSGTPSPGAGGPPAHPGSAAAGDGGAGAGGRDSWGGEPEPEAMNSALRRAARSGRGVELYGPGFPADLRAESTKGADEDGAGEGIAMPMP